MRYYIIAGEASGDLHGAPVIQYLNQLDPDAQIKCWGGDRMQQAGAKLVKHYKDLAFMGFVEVIQHLPKIFKNLKFCKEDILHFNPHVIVFIDYPGFNLRIAKWAKEQGFQTIYYISPQIWAWKENRIKAIQKSIDKMLVILPFETEFYQKYNYPTQFVGHPLVHTITENLKQKIIKISEKPIIALLPGSRTQEVQKNLPLMLQLIPLFPDYQFVIAQAPNLKKEWCHAFLNEEKEVIVNDQTYNILKQSKAAIVTSGTATLETALFGVPQIVCYKGNFISYFLAKMLIKVPYISLVNLILNKKAIPELIQSNFNQKQLKKHLNALLNEDKVQHQMQKDYNQLWSLLGHQNTPLIVAKEICNVATVRNSKVKN